MDFLFKFIIFAPDKNNYNNESNNNDKNLNN